MKKPAKTDAVFSELVKAARQMRTVTYPELAKIAGLAPSGVGMGRPLGYIRDEVWPAAGAAVADGDRRERQDGAAGGVIPADRRGNGPGRSRSLVAGDGASSVRYRLAWRRVRAAGNEPPTRKGARGREGEQMTWEERAKRAMEKAAELQDEGRLKPGEAIIVDGFPVSNNPSDHEVLHGPSNPAHWIPEDGDAKMTCTDPNPNDRIIAHVENDEYEIRRLDDAGNFYVATPGRLSFSDAKKIARLNAYPPGRVLCLRDDESLEFCGQ